jgi:hypothetical protein
VTEDSLNRTLVYRASDRLAAAGAERVFVMSGVGPEGDDGRASFRSCAPGSALTLAFLELFAAPARTGRIAWRLGEIVLHNGLLLCRTRKKLARDQCVRVVSTQHPFLVDDKLLKQGHSLINPTNLSKRESNAVAAGQCVRVLSTQHPFMVDDKLLKQGQSLINPTNLIQRAGQIVADRQCVRVASTQHLFMVDDKLLRQGHSLINPTNLTERASKIAADRQCVRVLSTQHPFMVGEISFLIVVGFPTISDRQTGPAPCVQMLASPRLFVAHRQRHWR